jgi:1-pyrroline-5-carboxylate dehydrogenase
LLARFVSEIAVRPGSIFNLIRWDNARTIKELFVPPVDYRYPRMG